MDYAVQEFPRQQVLLTERQRQKDMIKGIKACFCKLRHNDSDIYYILYLIFQ